MRSLDEFVGEGEDRAATPLEIGPSVNAKHWQKKLAELAKTSALPGAHELSLTAFTLIRGGDLFERTGSGKPARTPPPLVETYASAKLKLVANRAAKPEQDAAVAGVLRVLRGNPALVKRMLLAKPVSVVIIPEDHDYRSYGFPKHTNPNAAGIFWNSPRDEVALVGLREELIVEKPHLMVHEMAHAVHFLAFTEKERADIDKYLLPVYRSRRWVEEAVAIYAERAFGARYSDEELAQRDLYGQTRREWNDRQVFAKFIAELMRP